MNKTILSFAMLAIALPIIFCGCATIFGKSSYPVSVHSDPPGATVSITDKKSTEVFKGQTPATATLKSGAGFFSKAEYQVKITSPGYAEQVIPVNFRLNGWYFGNLLIGGILGMLIIDPATGAMWKLATPPINVTLNKSTTAVTAPTLKIIDIRDVTEDMKAHLVPVK